MHTFLPLHKDSVGKMAWFLVGVFPAPDHTILMWTPDKSLSSFQVLESESPRAGAACRYRLRLLYIPENQNSLSRGSWQPGYISHPVAFPAQCESGWCCLSGRHNEV